MLGRVGAEVIASIRIGFGVFSFTEEVTLAEVTLVDFSLGCETARLELIEGLAHVSGDDLVLHVGPLAAMRIIDGQAGSDGDETYRIGLTSDEDGVIVPGQLSVVYSAFEQRFGDDEVLPDNITADFGNGNDALDIEAAVTLAVTAFGGDGNDVLTGGAADDLLEGEAHDDRLFGNGGADTLIGGEGNDLLEGGAGADLIDGGSGADKVTYEDSPEGVIFVWDGAEFVGTGGDAQGDRLIGIEYIVGSSFGDVLFGNPSQSSTLVGREGDDVLTGGNAADFLLGETGADRIIGNGGRDGTSYVTSLGAVRIDLLTGAASGGDAEGDVLSSIEDVQGSAYYDDLRGTSAANLIDGFLGEDLIDGRGGDDEIIGGWGDDHVMAYGDGALLDGGIDRDLLDYSQAGSNVNVNLRLGTGDADEIVHVVLDNGDGTTTETERSTFEDLDGTAFDDTLEGDLQGNVIRGLGGSDTIFGGDGDDTILGGAGGDAIDGGTGQDWADYTDGFGVFVSLAGGFGAGSTAQGDTLTAIENLRGSGAADLLIGDAGDNVLAPGLSRSAGFDSVQGGAGFDTLLVDYSEATGDRE